MTEHFAPDGAIGATSSPLRTQSWDVPLIDNSEFASRSADILVSQSPEERQAPGSDTTETPLAAASSTPAFGDTTATDIALTAALENAELLAAVCQADDLRAAVVQVARQLQHWVGADRGAIGLAGSLGGNIRLQALTDTDRFSARSELVRQFEAAMDEAVWQDRVVTWPEVDGDDPAGNHAHRALSASLKNASLLTLPLRHGTDAPVGAVVLIGLDLTSALPRIRAFANHSQGALAAALGLWKQRSRLCLSRLWKRGSKGKQRRTVLGFATALLAVAALLCIPVPYRIRCACDVQPSARRFVVAPFDSSLEKTFVSPGDRITQGQVLARLDGRDIRCDLATTEAELQRVAKERDTALANGQTAAAQIARLEMDGLELKQQLLQQREQELEIKSPLDGILISGDWERSEGARLTIGQSLFEIGPLDEMVVEVAIPEDARRHAALAADVELQVNALPHRRWTGELAAVHPRAEIRDDQNVFIGEVPLANKGGELLPGMKGTARIHSTPQMLGWILFHKPWQTVRRWLGV